jgi:hypothetical protein
LAVGGVVPSGSPESLLARIEGVLIPSEVELKAGSKNEITYRHCHAVQVEKVCAQSLPKREYCRYRPETFGNFSRELFFLGVWRPLLECNKAPILRDFRDGGVSYLKVERVAGWGGRIRTWTFRNDLPLALMQPSNAQKSAKARSHHTEKGDVQ